MYAHINLLEHHGERQGRNNLQNVFLKMFFPNFPLSSLTSVNFLSVREDVGSPGVAAVKAGAKGSQGKRPSSVDGRGRAHRGEIIPRELDMPG